MRTGSAGVELHWIPLGAGSPIVELSGRAYEAIVARRGRRPPCALYHSALTVRAPEGTFSIEQTPVPRGDPSCRGVVAAGPVGIAWARGPRMLRYEVRCCKDGVIPDLGAAVGPPLVVTSDAVAAARVLTIVATVPTLVWGRDPGGMGDMWNSNSVVAWTLSCSGIDLATVAPPFGGRAPGWRAGLVVARRQTAGRG